MAFIRRVRTGSGATAVQIAEYVGGRQRIVKHVGSAHTGAELGVLLARARALLEPPGQGALALDIEPTPPVVGLASPVDAPVLFDARSAGPVGRDGPGRVVATDARVLFDALSVVFTGLGFDVLGDEVFRDLVIARIVEPSSLLDSGRVLTDLGRRPASYATMKRTLARAEAQDYRGRIAAGCFAHAATSGDISLVLYDVTTLYFEADKEDDLRKVGYSKERRVDPQIVVGLLVDRHGFPLEIGCFAGNKAETLTILPVITAFQARHGLADMVVVADAGMLSATNLRELDEASLRFIVGSRMTKAPVDLASHFHWHGDAFTDGQVIDTITPKTGAHAARTTAPCAPNRSGTLRCTPDRGGRSGPTPTSGRSATGGPSPRRRTGPAPSSTGRRRPGPHGSSRPPTARAPWTRQPWTELAAWSGSRATSPTSAPT